MIQTNEFVIQFVSQNWITLTLLIGVLRAIAKMTPWSHDDSIMELISGMFTQVRGGGKK